MERNGNGERGKGRRGQRGEVETRKERAVVTSSEGRGESRLERREGIPLPQQKRGGGLELGSGQSSSLQGPGYPGCRPGQQIITLYVHLPRRNKEACRYNVPEPISLFYPSDPIPKSAFTCSSILFWTLRECWGRYSVALNTEIKFKHQFFAVLHLIVLAYIFKTSLFKICHLAWG